jgi:hypothetical protein
MTNSDTTFGVHNVHYSIWCEHTAEGGATVKSNNFANVTEAKEYFFHADALAMFEENCTWLGWRLPSEGVEAGSSGGLIMARGFGEVENSATKSHADKFQEDKTALLAAGKFFARANILGADHDGLATFNGTDWISG